MPYFTVTDFAAGLDLRRNTLTAPAGTLRSLKNAHITPGGEIEKRFAFVKLAEVDPASRGVVSVNQKLYVFMPGLEPARISGSVHTLTVDQEFLFTPGTTFVVGDGTSETTLTLAATQKVQDFLNIVNNNASLQVRAKFLIYDLGPPEKGGILLETRTDTPVIVGGTISASELAQLGLSSGIVTAAENVFDPASEWDIGALMLEVPAINDIIDYDLFDNLVYAIVDVDGAHVAHCFNGIGVPDAAGLFCRTYKTKMHTVEGSVLRFSSIGDAGDWNGTGSGSIDLGMEDADMTDCMALEVYYDKLAIFSQTACQLWNIDPDPLLTSYAQTLRQAGTMATHSVLQYGSGDVLFASHDGIRSLRARNSSLAASVSDVGSPLDPIMQSLFREKGSDWVGRIISVLQPVTGRFWVILPDRIYILSAFPGPKITAWSEYEPVDSDGNVFEVTAATVHSHHIVLRDNANRIYVFGGNDDFSVVYDQCNVNIEFPFLGGDKPATKKKFHGIDAVAEGEWDVYVSFDPDSGAEDFAGKLIGSTYQQGRYPIEGDGTHISVRLRSVQPGPLLLSSLTVHYDLAEAG